MVQDNQVGLSNVDVKKDTGRVTVKILRNAWDPIFSKKIYTVNVTDNQLGTIVTVSAFDQDINVYNSVSNKYLRV
jgi:hypothetical protein